MAALARADILDVITIGRSSVDLYGEQVGGRLEDMQSFSKYVGGSPTNMAIGASRLGLRSAVITRVGNEPMGRFIVEQLRRENVVTDGVVIDQERLTALAILGIRDETRFPLIFYRENCADMALCEADIAPTFIERAKAVVVTGTHLSHTATCQACLKALELARKAKARTALDIDYRPNLWGLAGHDSGEERYIGSAQVTAQLQEFIPAFDLIVGTEEEMHIAGGSTDTLQALRNLRKLTDAALVCKRGVLGAVVFTGEDIANWDDGHSVPTEKVEVFNVLGAGDGFMAGLLRGWVAGEEWPVALRWANICGAFAVSRHGCAPAYPSWEELQWYQKNGTRYFALRKDTELEHVHWATNRRKHWAQLRILAFDHRKQMRDLPGADDAKIGEFKCLCMQAASAVAQGRLGYGVLCDDVYGRQALYDATDTGLWVARPVEVPGSKPLALQIDPDCGAALKQWPADHVVKVLCLCSPDDPPQMWEQQLATLARLFTACRNAAKQILAEIVVPRNVSPDTVIGCMARIYDAQIKPDWWKLQPVTDRHVWQQMDELIESRDPWCAGIVVLGQEASIDELCEAFSAAIGFRSVRGFAVGRTLFAATAAAWFTGEINDEQAREQVTAKYRQLCDAWDKFAQAARREFK